MRYQRLAGFVLIALVGAALGVVAAYIAYRAGSGAETAGRFTTWWRYDFLDDQWPWAVAGSMVALAAIYARHLLDS